MSVTKTILGLLLAAALWGLIILLMAAPLMQPP